MSLCECAKVGLHVFMGFKMDQINRHSGFQTLKSRGDNANFTGMAAPGVMIAVLLNALSCIGGSPAAAGNVR